MEFITPEVIAALRADDLSAFQQCFELKAFTKQTPIIFQLGCFVALEGSEQIAKHVSALLDGNDDVHALAEAIADVPGDDITDLSDTQGNSILHHAVEQRAAKCVNFLLRHFPALNAEQNDRKETPLHTAARVGDVSIFNVLLTANADMFHVDENNKTVLHTAAGHGQVGVINRLTQEPDYDDLLVKKDSDGGSACHEAAEQQQLQVLTILQAKGGKVLAADDYGDTCLHIACRKGYEAILRWLLTLQPDLRQENNNNETPLILAAMGGHEAVLNLLLRQAQNDFKNTGLSVLGFIHQLHAELHDEDQELCEDDVLKSLHWLLSRLATNYYAADCSSRDIIAALQHHPETFHKLNPDVIQRMQETSKLSIQFAAIVGQHGQLLQALLQEEIEFTQPRKVVSEGQSVTLSATQLQQCFVIEWQAYCEFVESNEPEFTPHQLVALRELKLAGKDKSVLLPMPATEQQQEILFRLLQNMYLSRNGLTKHDKAKGWKVPNVMRNSQAKALATSGNANSFHARGSKPARKAKQQQRFQASFAK